MSNKPRRPRASSAQSHPSVVSHRHTRLEHILLDELQSLLRDEAGDPALVGVTLLSVQLSPDGGHARFAYAVAGPLAEESLHRERSQDALLRATVFLRSRLAHRLELKKLPRLGFTFVGMRGAEWPAS